jgi:2-dehydro-3-deoxygluconokinase
MAEPAPSLVAFGELLLRLDPADGDRIVRARGFEARYTGAEANVAASLRGFGIATEIVSAVPDSALGEACISFLRQYGVGTELILRRPGRLGVLFHEPGGVGRSAQVVYDRAGSVFAGCEPEAYDWHRILAGHSWLHLTGTAAALGGTVQAAVENALAAAEDLGVRVSLDVNYRAALWTHASAGRTLEPLVRHVDVLLGLGADTAAVFGLEPPGADAGAVVAAHVAQARHLRDRFDIPVVAGLVRVPGRQRTGLLGVAVDATGSHVTAEYPVLDTVGRIGTGDAFAAGLLRGLLLGRSPGEALEFAAAAAHLKQSVRGDVNLVSVAEVQAVLDGTVGDRVLR